MLNFLDGTILGNPRAILKLTAAVWLIILVFSIAATATPFITGPTDIYPFKSCTGGSCRNGVHTPCNDAADIWRAIEAFALLSIFASAAGLLALCLTIAGKWSNARITTAVLVATLIFVSLAWILEVVFFDKKFCGNPSFSSGGGNSLDASFGLFVSACGLGILAFILYVFRG